MRARPFAIKPCRRSKCSLFIKGFDIAVDTVVAMNARKIPARDLRDGVAMRLVERLDLRDGGFEEIGIGGGRQLRRLSAAADSSCEEREKKCRLQACTQAWRLLEGWLTIAYKGAASAFQDLRHHSPREPLKKGSRKRAL